jgi:hypothetical protein
MSVPILQSVTCRMSNLECGRGLSNDQLTKSSAEFLGNWVV